MTIYRVIQGYPEQLPGAVNVIAVHPTAKVEVTVFGIVGWRVEVYLPKLIVIGNVYYVYMAVVGFFDLDAG